MHRNEPTSLSVPIIAGLNLEQIIDVAVIAAVGALLPMALTRSANYAWLYGTVCVSPTIAGSVAKLEGKLLDDGSKVRKTSTDIDHYLGTSPSGGAAKLAAIRRMLRMHPFYHEWTLPSRMEDNPLIGLVEINGFAVDIRHAPRQLQEIAYHKGLIPYIPADRMQGE
jgi:hypothetical protein